MVDNITNNNNTSLSSVKTQTVVVDKVTNHNIHQCFVKLQEVVVELITNHNDMNFSSVKPQTVVVVIMTNHNMNPVSNLKQ